MLKRAAVPCVGSGFGLILVDVAVILFLLVGPCSTCEVAACGGLPARGKSEMPYENTGFGQLELLQP